MRLFRANFRDFCTFLVQTNYLCDKTARNQLIWSDFTKIFTEN